VQPMQPVQLAHLSHNDGWALRLPRLACGVGGRPLAGDPEAGGQPGCLRQHAARRTTARLARAWGAGTAGRLLGPRPPSQLWSTSHSWIGAQKCQGACGTEGRRQGAGGRGQGAGGRGQGAGGRRQGAGGRGRGGGEAGSRGQGQGLSCSSLGRGHLGACRCCRGVLGVWEYGWARGLLVQQLVLHTKLQPVGRRPPIGQPPTRHPTRLLLQAMQRARAPILGQRLHHHGPAPN
jgi:hypothetical protein